jgi:UDP-N-acetylmuramoyl-tripeptide--D-alanyl-D-alanine ligase
VGDQGPEYHAEVGEYAADKGIETLLCVGELMRYGAAVFPGARHFGGMDALIQAVHVDLHGYRSVLVKGSRFMKMERVVQAIEELSLRALNHDSDQTKEMTHVA